MPIDTRVEPLQLAERAHGLVDAQPFKAHALAEEALALSRVTQDAEAEVVALHALGFARYALGDPRGLRTIRAAVRAGERNGYRRRSALARRHLAVQLAYAGKTSAALSEIDAACVALTGLDRARSEVFRVGISHLAGQGRDGLDRSAAALQALRRAGDTLWEARLLYNRAAVLGEQLGDVDAARRDLEQASVLYASLGLDAAVANAQVQLARLRLMEGDPVGALAELDAIRADALSDWAASWLHLNRAEVLVALRLLPEAQAALARFVETSVHVGAVDSVNKARLDAARIAVLAGDHQTAAAAAALAGRSFAARRQTTYAAIATLVRVRAAVAGERVRSADLRAGRRAAEALAAAGFVLDGLRGQLLVARAATTLGRLAIADRALIAAWPLERSGGAADRVELRHVRALVSRGDTGAALRALRSGLRLLEEYRGALGALELRVTASGLGTELSELGLEIALESGKPLSVLSWAELLRGNALRLPLVRPPADPELRAHQVELRRLAARAREAEERGRPAHGLATRRSEAEAAIRARTRHVHGGGAARTARLRVPDAARALGERVLVEYVELDGTLYALTLAGGRLRLHELGANDAANELEWLRFALGRLASGASSPAKRAAALANAQSAAAVLDRRLVAPLADAIGDAPLVVVPTGALHALPWGALPSLRGRPVVVAPSLSVWLELASRPRSRRRRHALVAGPRLRHSRAEVRSLATLLPSATVLQGRDATATAALRALDGAALAHVACHGRFRADSPLFSSLELADGPLTALDLQQLHRAPEVLVLSSCDLALSDRHPGDELLGLSAALLAMGTRTIVASVVPVPDAASRRLMLAFHAELAGGATPAAALAGAQATLRGGSTALAGFVCLGSG